MRKILQAVLILLLTHSVFPQIKFTSYQNYKVSVDQIRELESSSTRNIFLLNGPWSVYSEKDKEKTKTTISVPSVYNGEGELIFEKQFSVTQQQIDSKLLNLRFLGVNNSADIYLNSALIYRHAGGNVPFSVILPNDMLHAGNQKNVISVKIVPLGPERNSIPMNYLSGSPRQLPGIFRDVYIEESARVAVQKYNVQTESVSSNRARLKLDLHVLNRNFAKPDTQFNSSQNIEIRFSALAHGGTRSEVSSSISTELKKGKEKDIQVTLDINEPVLWSPEQPQAYRVQIEILKDGAVVDQISRDYAIYDLRFDKEVLHLNDREYQLNGVSYVPVYKEYAQMLTYERMQQDILLIKESGFNVVFFSGVMPHPYLLKLCQQYGLLAFTELPVSGIPSALLTENTLLTSSKNYINEIVDELTKYSALAAISLGSGFSGSDESDVYFLTQAADQIKQRCHKLVFASFLGSTIKQEIPNLDFYGVKVMNKPLDVVDKEISKISDVVGKGRTLLSGVTYTPTEESSNGYANPFTFEAQAKYYGDVFDFIDIKALPGCIINTFADYRTGYYSLIGKYNADQVLPFGLVTEDRNTGRTAYKVIYASLHNLQKISVPIGVKKDRSPFVFIVFGLIIALCVGSLFNSGKKFREDATRALIRPYNFFADVRDMRIISVTKSIILAVLIAATMSLITASFLHYFRQNTLLENILLATTSDSLMELISFMAWHPGYALFFFTVIYLLTMLLMSVVIRIAAMSVISRVFFSSTFYIAIWSCIPVILLVPFGIVLYRILVPEVVNMYIYIAFAAFSFWLFLRLLKGVYVVFDSTPGRIYFFGLGIFAVLVFITAAYFQWYYLSADYILHAFREMRAGI